MYSATKTACTALLMLSAFASTALASAYEGFDYGSTPTLDGKSGGTGWASPWMDVALWLETQTIATGLEYPGLVTSPGAAQSPPTLQFALATFARAFGSIASPDNEVYLSFLLRPDAGFGSGGCLRMGQWPKYIFVGSPFGTYQYGIAVGEGALWDLTPHDVVAGETVFIVLKIKLTPGVNTQLRMYLNPDPSQPEPATPDAAYTTPIISVLPTALSINNEGGYTTDEIRVGTSWAEVVVTPPICTGDLNDNGIVDGFDLGILLGFWGLPGGDLNGDGATNGFDLGLLLGEWGPCAVERDAASPGMMDNAACPYSGQAPPPSANRIGDALGQAVEGKRRSA